MLDGWQNLLKLYQTEIDELEGKLEILQREVKHIKQEIEKIS
jgi:FtsZ-binding cell division protein ZapB